MWIIQQQKKKKKMFFIDISFKKKKGFDFLDPHIGVKSMQMKRK